MTANPVRTNPDPVADQIIAACPLPTPATLRHRKNVPYQLLRLAAINLKMLRVISSSHRGSH
ncbi:MAG: hypothetical protein LBV06_01045 [Propionibacteriaceae bacterium]|jgi:hypothetical protein|nr:hypothetical protein [Propionibacteriaceae bacterium]